MCTRDCNSSSSLLGLGFFLGIAQAGEEGVEQVFAFGGLCFQRLGGAFDGGLDGVLEIDRVRSPASDRPV